MPKNAQDVNNSQVASTSDGVPRPNGMTADQWLERVLYSGHVTRVAQHLALVIFALAVRQQKNGVAASMRDLERITGWGRSTISSHLSELDAFIHVELAAGRGKTLFELQGMIEDAIGAAIASGLIVQPPVVASQPDTTPDTIPDTNVVAKEPDTIPDTTPDTNVVASQPDTTPDTTPISNPLPPLKERSPPAPPLKKITPPSHTHTQTGASASQKVHVHENPPAPGFTHLGHGAWLNCEKIWHPKFSISFPAVEMQLALSVDTKVLDCAVICKSAALQWAAAIEGGQNAREVIPQNIVGAIVGGARRGVYSGLEHAARVAAVKPKAFKPSRW